MNRLQYLVSYVKANLGLRIIIDGKLVVGSARLVESVGNGFGTIRIEKGAIASTSGIVNINRVDLGYKVINDYPYSFIEFLGEPRNRALMRFYARDFMKDYFSVYQTIHVTPGNGNRMFDTCDRFLFASWDCCDVHREIGAMHDGICTRGMVYHEEFKDKIPPEVNPYSYAWWQAFSREFDVILPDADPFRKIK